MRRAMLIAAVAACLASCAGRPADPPGALGSAGLEEMTHLWVYVSTNLLVDRNVDNALAVISRAARAGYNGVAIADTKFMRWDGMPEKYYRNVRRFRQRCRDLGMECVPCVAPFGYSDSMLSHDPNLAAGLPVRDAPFVVRRGRLIPADDSARLANGDFEAFRADGPAGWDWADEPGKITFIDRATRSSGAISLRMQDIDVHSPRYGHGRIMQTVKVRPFRYYHVSAAVKTRNFAAADKVRIAVLATDGSTLCYYEPLVEKTQDWQRIDVTFNSLQFDAVRVYLGVWDGKGGTIWWDDARIEPGGLVNVLRRDGAPLRMTDADGPTVFVEGRDFTPIADPLLGAVPYRGSYDVWHRQPDVAIPAGSRLKEGQRVLLSYYHPAIVHRRQVTCCMSEPEVYGLIDWQMARVRDAMDPDGYFMQHDEIRVAGWDESCTRRGLTPGQILADNVRRCTDIIRRADPDKPIYVWSDMFDPNHNAGAKGRYYLVAGEGPWYGSWEGLDPDVVIVNWHRRQPGRSESLRHFEALGNKQILAGYYDKSPEEIADWLADAAGVRGVIGVMYTTWRRNYDDLEKFAAAVRAVGAARGR